jgi:uncharacterized protein (TIGR01777 family)
MRVFITGGTGFVGTNLTKFLIDRGDQVTIMARNFKSQGTDQKNLDFVAGDGMKPGKWQEVVPQHDLLVNLAGVSVFKRWDDSYKKLLRDSRILTTRNLVDAIPVEPRSPITLLSTSGTGYYGFTGDAELAEESPPGNDFLANLAQDWEAEARKAETKGVRVVIARFGIVFGKDGGALTQMALPFRFFVGGPVGNGKQWVPWIHIEDLCRAMLFLAQKQDIQGPVNFTAPEPVKNKDLAKAIGKAMHRPSFMPAPSFMIKLVLGEFGSVILKGQRAVPRVLQRCGFTFRYPGIQEAVSSLLAA